MKRLFLTLLLIAGNTFAFDAIETAIINGETDLLIGLLQTETNISEVQKIRYLDLAQEMVLSSRRDVEINNIMPYSKKGIAGALGCWAFAVATLMSLDAKEEPLSTRVGTSILGCIALSGSIYVVRKAMKESREWSLSLRNKYLAAINIKQIIHQI